MYCRISWGCLWCIVLWVESWVIEIVWNRIEKCVEGDGIFNVFDRDCVDFVGCEELEVDVVESWWYGLWNVYVGWFGEVLCYLDCMIDRNWNIWWCRG